MSDLIQGLTGLWPLHVELALLWLLLPLLWWRRWRARATAADFAPLSLCEPGLPRSLRVRCLWLPSACADGAIALLVFAAMQPVRRHEEPAVHTGIDVVLCLDASSSMAARDLDPQRDRLAIARAAASQFVAGRPDDRIGIVRFARFPDLVCPPTLDHGAVEQLLARLQFVAPDGPEDATGIGTAVARAVEVLSRAAAKARVVVLVTDGEENVAAAGMPDEIGPLQAAQLAVRHGVRVHCLTVRGPAATVDTAQVEELARRTGGRFFAADDAAAISAVYREIAALEPTPLATPRLRLDDAAAPLLAAALLAMCIAVVLRRTWFEVLP